MPEGGDALAPVAQGAGAPAARPRRRLRAALRWTAAVAVFAAVGTLTAYGITRMERTDVPGLATESDGRWNYPTLAYPPMPSGSPGPLAEDNPAGTHHADLRALVLPAPKGATEDKALRGEDGWLATKDFLAQFPEKTHRAEFGQFLTDYGLRHIAARGWTTEDGTETRVYLLRFATSAVVQELTPGRIAPAGGPAYRVRGDNLSEFDNEYAEAVKPLPDVSRYVYAEMKPYGAQQVRQAYVTAGDVLALIVQSRKGKALAVPFQQTVTLQSQLLS
ncbi:hypothetical protein [Streptomyces sp. NPDC048002]|uniref:hypothetical protein n=1 Tax=Streptomyces sp. NPDC048002 TaxID=3154344 RepID=UPI0033F20A1F